MHPTRNGAELKEFERGGILAWLAAAVAAVLLVVVAGGLYLARTVRVQQDGRNVHVETPFVSVNVQHDGKSNPAIAGIAVYPGATANSGEDNATVDVGSDTSGIHISASKWRTPDPIDKVQQFYESHAPNCAVGRDGAGGGHFNVYTMKHGEKCAIGLREVDGLTEISLAYVGVPKAN